MEAFLMFVLYAFFGCVLEEVYYFALHRRYVSKRTLIKLPLCPVYGFAALVLAAVNGRTESAAMLFINGFFAVSCVELAFYLVSERLYDVKWWDYSGRKMNFMGGICLFYSVLWGVLNIVFASVIHPAVQTWLAGFSEAGKILCGFFLAVYIAADFKETHTELLKHKNGEENRIFEKFLYLK